MQHNARLQHYALLYPLAKLGLLAKVYQTVFEECEPWTLRQAATQFSSVHVCIWEMTSIAS